MAVRRSKTWMEILRPALVRWYRSIRVSWQRFADSRNRKNRYWRFVITSFGRTHEAPRALQSGFRGPVRPSSSMFTGKCLRKQPARQMDTALIKRNLALIVFLVLAVAYCT